MINWSAVGVIVLLITQVIILASLYYGLKADNATLKSSLDQAVIVERAARQAEHVAHKTEVMGLVDTVRTTMLDLTRRISTLESGQDEWTKTLRERTHELANQINTLVLKVDRLERPHV